MSCTAVDDMLLWIMIWVISSMLVVNVPTGFTMAAFVDREDSKVNSISAGTLDVKMEAASEVGVNLKQGYNGDLTSKQAGSVGGQMVKKMIKAYEESMK